MSALRDLLWGLLNGLWAGGSIALVVSMLSAVNRSVHADAIRSGGIIHLGLLYLGIGAICGLTLGILRELTHSRWGVRVVGGILTCEAFSVWLYLESGDAGFTLEDQVFVAVVAFGMGLLIGPLWRDRFGSGGRAMPPFGRWFPDSRDSGSGEH